MCVCVCHIFFIFSPIDEYLGCFRVLAIVNSTAINIDVKIFFQIEVKITQSCLTVTPMDYIVHGILQARILEWVAFPFSRESSQPRDPTQVSHTTGRFFTS